MKDTYTAAIKQSGCWWIGWVEEVQGVNCQEQTKEEHMFRTASFSKTEQHPLPGSMEQVLVSYK